MGSLTAVLIADGGRVLSDLATLRDQGELYGPVASDATLWWALDEIGEPQRRTIARARAKTLRACVVADRQAAWADSTVAGHSLNHTLTTTSTNAMKINAREPRAATCQLRE